MDPVVLLVVVVVAVALAFDFTNGFHDAANAIATSITTGALSPRIALFMAAVMNFAGALLGVKVAQTIVDIIAIDQSSHTATERLTIVLAALLGAIAWNIVTWWFGVPSSSSHSLIGGIVGAGVASATTVHWSSIIANVVIPMVISPVLGFLGAFALMIAISWIFRRARASKARRGFRFAQTFSAAAVALGHGLQDAQKTMGIIVLALVAAGLESGDNVPTWVSLAAAAAIAAGTFSGGWRVIRTLGRRIIDLDPTTAFTAETTAAGTLYFMGFALGAPVSTTHTITAAIMGAGATRRVHAIRWSVVRPIAYTWIFTMPAAALIAAGIYTLANLA